MRLPTRPWNRRTSSVNARSSSSATRPMRSSSERLTICGGRGSRSGAKRDLTYGVLPPAGAKVPKPSRRCGASGTVARLQGWQGGRRGARPVLRGATPPEGGRNRLSPLSSRYSKTKSCEATGAGFRYTSQAARAASAQRPQLVPDALGVLAVPGHAQPVLLASQVRELQVAVDVAQVLAHDRVALREPDRALEVVARAREIALPVEHPAV